MNNLVKTSMAQDFKESINWIIANYETAGVSFADGFQKDAIQNACGARSKNNWNGWKCKIDYVENSKGKFLIVEDEGTEGLTGPNLTTNEIQKIIDSGSKIDSSWRLARFSSRNVSGGNQTGAGKYGVGKSMYSACSTDYSYYYDSLRNDGLYVANHNEKGNIFDKALENDEAKNYILNNTGLKAKTTVGTRIIIIEPKQEIIEEISSGKIIEYIQESWWRSIEKMPKESGIFLNGKRVESPVFDSFEKEYELNKVELYSEGYRVKKFGFFINKKDSNNKWHGISYYRKGMKIGRIDINDLPNSIKDRYWGYIEVDNEWEEALAAIEDTIHYGVKSKHTTTYQNLKSYCSKKVNQLLIDWGYIKDKENEDKKIQEALKEISADVQDLFDEMGFEDLGKGPKKPDYAVRLKNIIYPNEDDTTVTTGESIKFGFRIVNDYLIDKKFDINIYVITMSDNHVVSKIEQNIVKIESGKIFDKDLEFVVKNDSAERYSENRIILEVKVVGSNKEKRKEIPFFYDTVKEDNSRKEVLLNLHTISLPNENTRRVNFGDTIKGLSYIVENKRNFSLKYSLNISIHDCSNPNPKNKAPIIMDVARIIKASTPFEETVIDEIPDIYIDENIIGKYLDSGEIEIRARLVALENSDEYEKGDKITHYYYKLFLNKDDKNGKYGSFEPRTDDNPDDYRRSWCKGGNRIIYINSGHPAYKSAQDDEEGWREYLKQEMLKQYVMLYLEEGKLDMFGNGRDITKMDPIEANKCIMEKIEEIYRKSFR